MGHLSLEVALIGLWVLAGLATLWIVGPLLLFLSSLRKHSIEVRDDPGQAAPDAKDADYARCFAELTAGGFSPTGKTVERFRFFTPLHWLRVSNGCRWLASPDRRVYVVISRIAGGHPQRMTAYTTFEGGGLLATSTAPTGLGGEIGDRYRRVEVGAEGPDELLRQHEHNVNQFCRDTGLQVRPAALGEMAAESLIIARPYVARSRVMGLYAVALVYLMPVWSLLASVGRAHRHSLVIPVGLSIAAGLFALMRVLALPEFRRIRWVAFVGLVVVGMSIPVLTQLTPRRRSDHRTPNAAERRSP